MSRGPYAKVAARNGALLERVRELKADHPFWGYRRVWAYLRYVDRLTVNQKRVYGVMKANDLLVKPNLKLRARRKADTRKPRPSRPNEWWGIDMTKVMIEGFGWIYLVIVLDWHTKKVVGHYAGLQARAWHWLVALNRAVNRQFPGGIEGQSLNLMADNGCQPTSLLHARLRCSQHPPGVHELQQPQGQRRHRALLADPEGGAGLAPRVDQPQRLLRRPRSLACRVQRQLPPFGARLSSAECRRSRASRPRHSLSRGLLNGVQYRL